MRTRTFLAAGALSVIACAKLADLEGSVPPPPPGGGGGTESPSHLAGDVVISPPSLEFGPVGCGTKATPQAITIQNTTDVAVPYEAKLAEGSGFVLDGPASGEIPPKGTVTIPVTVQPTAPVDLTGNIFINAGASYMEVRAHAVGRGAVLEFVPNLVDFGQLRLNASAVIPVELKNTGSAPATVTAFEGGTSALSLNLVETLTIAPGESASINAAVVAPSDVGEVEATLKPVVSSAVCSSLPEVKLRAEAINTNVTLSVADFGTVSCNFPGETTKEVTISNFAQSQITLTAADFKTTSESHFEVLTPLPLSVSGATGDTPGTAQLVVRSKPIGVELGVIEETLVLTFDELVPKERETKARIDVRGAILQIQNPQIELYAFVDQWIPASEDFKLRNTGNAPITVAYDFARTEGPAAWIPEEGPETVPAGGTVNMTIRFRPSNRGTHRATMTPRRVSGATACTPMPVGSATGKTIL